MEKKVLGCLMKCNGMVNLSMFGYYNDRIDKKTCYVLIPFPTKWKGRKMQCIADKCTVYIEFEILEGVQPYTTHSD